MKKRGSVCTVFDGRYKFSRYFSPLDHNNPQTLDDLYKWNDVELYDLQTDPGALVNLAAHLNANRDLTLDSVGTIHPDRVRVETKNQESNHNHAPCAAVNWPGVR